MAFSVWFCVARALLPAKSRLYLNSVWVRSKAWGNKSFFGTLPTFPRAFELAGRCLLEEIMTAFTSYRVTHEFIQTNPATPEKVFFLLCPVRESDWLPGWQCDLIYSDSGIAELGCVFTTPNPPSSVAHGEAASEITWIVTDYDPAAFRIAFVWINPGHIITELRIQLAATEQKQTRTHIRYRYTGLSLQGNLELEGYTQKWFEAKIQNWETTINSFLRTGRKMSASSDHPS